MPVTADSIGLLRVDLPAGLSDANVKVEFHVPGYGLAVPVLLICTEAAATPAVTSTFCLKFVSVRVFWVTPSLHLTNT